MKDLWPTFRNARIKAQSIANHSSTYANRMAQQLSNRFNEPFQDNKFSYLAVNWKHKPQCDLSYIKMFPFIGDYIKTRMENATMEAYNKSGQYRI